MLEPWPRFPRCCRPERSSSDGGACPISTGSWPPSSSSLPELQRWLPWARAMPTADEELAVLEAGEADFDADREWAYLLFEVGLR